MKLIKHTLAVDPRKRATVTDILNNPWFRVDLPASLFAPVTKQLSDSVMNGQAIEAVSEVCLVIYQKFQAPIISRVLAKKFWPKVLKNFLILRLNIIRVMVRNKIFLSFGLD